MVNDCEEKIKICLASGGILVYDEPKLEGLMTKIVGVLLPLPFNDVFDYQADDDIRLGEMVAVSFGNPRHGKQDVVGVVWKI